MKYSLVSALPPTPAPPSGMSADDGAVSAGMVLHQVRESARDPKISRPRPSSPNSCTISHVFKSCHSCVEYTLSLSAGDHSIFGLTKRLRKARRACFQSSKAEGMGRTL